MAETEGKKRGTRSKRAIVVDSLTELVRIELEQALNGGSGVGHAGETTGVYTITPAQVAEQIAKGLVLNAWDLDHHPVADRFTIIWDVPA